VAARGLCDAWSPLPRGESGFTSDKSKGENRAGGSPLLPSAAFAFCRNASSSSCRSCKSSGRETMTKRRKSASGTRSRARRAGSGEIRMFQVRERRSTETRVNNAGGCERHKNIVARLQNCRTSATSNKSPGGRGRAEQIN